MSLHPCFRRRWFMQVCLGKTSNDNRQRVDTGHECFTIVAQATAKICPKPAQSLFSNERTWYQELDWTTEAMNPWMKGGEGWMPTYTNMCFYVPAWANIAVCQLCRERQPLRNSHDGPELKMFGSMPWCSFPWQKLLPRLAQNCCTVQIWSMR